MTRTLEDVYAEMNIDLQLIAQKKLSAKERNALKDSQFAYITSDGERKLPLNDANHVRNAISRFSSTDFESPAKKAAAKRKILNAARKFGVDATKIGGKKVAQGSFDGTFGQPSSTTTKQGQPGPKKEMIAQAAKPGMIVQANAECRVITAVLQTPNQENDPPMNRPDEVFEYTTEAVRDMAWSFAEEQRLRSIGVGHTEIDWDTGEIMDPDGEHAVMVETYLAPVNFTMIDPSGENRMILQGSWVGSFRITSDEVWDKVLDGTYQAPSIVVDEYEELPQAG